MKIFYYLLILSYIVNYIWINDTGYSTDSGILPNFYYFLLHANVFHLSANVIFFHELGKTAKILRNQTGFKGIEYVMLASGVAISVLSSFISVYDTPTVGASGVGFAIMGMITSFYSSKRNFFVLFLAVAMSFALSLFVNFNAMLHLYSCILGVAAGFVIRFAYGSKK